MQHHPGKKFLDHLTDGVKNMGIISHVANMASKNRAGIHFHFHHGLTEVGRLQNAVRKFGGQLDMVRMQKVL
jgi:phosphinothricin acetyltransferase